MNLPGWTTNFIYDEFHPDPVYDNMRVAVDDCINYFLSKTVIDYLTFYKKENLQLNEHAGLTQDQLKQLVNQFQQAYDKIESSEDEMDARCTINDDLSTVTGKYSLDTVTSGKKFHLSGNWKVDFAYDNEFGYWEIFNIQIEGINF